MSGSSRHLIAGSALVAACFGVAVTNDQVATATAAPAATPRGAAITYSGAFEFQGLASNKTGKRCRGEGSFGEAKPGALVTVSERNAAGDFSTLGTGKLAKGKLVTVSGDTVCRMAFRVRAAVAPAGDSTVYLEVKGVAFDIRSPAADVADGDLGTWTCEFSDNTCSLVVGRD